MSKKGKREFPISTAIYDFTDIPIGSTTENEPLSNMKGMLEKFWKLIKGIAQSLFLVNSDTSKRRALVCPGADSARAWPNVLTDQWISVDLINSLLFLQDMWLWLSLLTHCSPLPCLLTLFSSIIQIHWLLSSTWARILEFCSLNKSLQIMAELFLLMRF